MKINIKKDGIYLESENIDESNYIDEVFGCTLPTYQLFILDKKDSGLFLKTVLPISCKHTTNEHGAILELRIESKDNIIVQDTKNIYQSQVEKEK
jgi:hypothetical protein